MQDICSPTYHQGSRHSSNGLDHPGFSFLLADYIIIIFAERSGCYVYNKYGYTTMMTTSHANVGAKGRTFRLGAENQKRGRGTKDSGQLSHFPL